MLAVGCGRFGFEATNDGGGSGSGSGSDGGFGDGDAGTFAMPRCAVPARPDVSAPTTTITTCTENAARTALSIGGVVVFDCAPGTVIPVSSPLQVPLATVIAGNGVTFDGQNATTVFEVTFGGKLTLLDATVTRGSTTTSGGGILVDFGASLVVYDSTFTDNHGPATSTMQDSGGAIAGLPDNATVEIYRSRFERNASANGGAVGVFADLTIADSVFLDNHATGTPGSGGHGGAINNSGGGDLTLCEVTIANNTAGDLGGGVMKVSTTQTAVDRWERVHLVGNTGGNVGGAYLDHVSLRLRQVDIAENTGATAGGLWTITVALDAENLAVVGNTVTDGLGGGLRLETSTGTLAFATVANNNASCPTCWAAGVLGAGALSVRASVFADNVAGSTPTTCDAMATDTGANFQWPTASDRCATSVTFADPMLGGVQDASGVDGTYRVRTPSAGTPLAGVMTGCPTIDITGRTRPMPCTAGAIEP